MKVRTARHRERTAVRNVLDGAALQVPSNLTEAIARDEVFVAVEGTTDERLLGALVLNGQEIEAIAVRTRRRDQGIGTALVEAVTARYDRVVTECDPRVVPFWQSVGFEITEHEERDRYRGTKQC